MEQRPTVLMRVFGETRSKLDQLKLPRNEWGYAPKESYAQIIERIANQAIAAKESSEKKPAAEKKPRRRARARKVVNRRPRRAARAEVVNRKRRRAKS